MIHKVTVKTEWTFQPQEINDLIVCALEGGIYYWCNKAEKAIFPSVPKGYEGKIEYASDYIGYGGTLILHDDESGEKHELTISKFLKGIKKYCEESSTAPQNLMDEHDADIADQIIQYAIFDEVIYS